MKTKFCIIVIVFCLWNINTQAQQNPKPLAAISALNQLLTQKQVLGIGEIHASNELYQFLEKWVQTPGFYQQVNDVLIEFGNYHYQNILDQYIAGKSVPFEQLKQVWQNTTESPTAVWDAPVYFQFLQTIRKLNQKIPLAHRIRVIAADNPIEWKKVHSRKDYRKYLGRDAHFARLIKTEVIQKNRKAVLIIGGIHITKKSSPFPGRKKPRKSITERINQVYPGKIMVVQALGSFGRSNKIALPKMKNWPNESLIYVKNNWVGQLPVATFVRRQTKAQTPKLTRADQTDAYLFLRPFDQLTYSKADKAIFQNKQYWQELNRRCRARYGCALVPESQNSSRPIPEKWKR